METKFFPYILVVRFISIFFSLLHLNKMVVVAHWCLWCALDRNLFATFFFILPFERMESLGRDDLFCFLMDLIWWSAGHCYNRNNNNKTLSQEMLCTAFTLLASDLFWSLY